MRSADGIDELYKSTKLNLNGDARHQGQATVQDEVESETAGPELPLDEEDQIPDDDAEGRFFGGGITNDTADVLDFIDKRDKDDATVSFR